MPFPGPDRPGPVPPPGPCAIAAPAIKSAPIAKPSSNYESNLSSFSPCQPHDYFVRILLRLSGFASSSNLRQRLHRARHLARNIGVYAGQHLFFLLGLLLRARCVGRLPLLLRLARWLRLARATTRW